MKRTPRIRLGCDQQGRHPEAAEAATEVGAEGDAPTPAQLFRGVLRDLLIACALVASVIGTLWLALPWTKLLWAALP